MKTMRKISMKNRPIIFPSYVKYLSEQGCRFIIDGKKTADIELTRILFDAEINELGFDVLPEIMLYNIQGKVWEEVHLKNNEQVQLIGSSSKSVVTYYPVTSVPSSVNACNILASFLMQFSAAKISFY